jgi:hypothetical protein
MIKLPVYITPKEVADILGWTMQKARRWMRNAKILEVRGGRLVTTPDKLRDAFPEVWSEMLDAAEARED